MDISKINYKLIKNNMINKMINNKMINNKMNKIAVNYHHWFKIMNEKNNIFD